MDLHKHTVRTNCKFCGKLFESFNFTKACPVCDKNMDSYFDKIRAFLAENPGATTAETCAALDLPAAIITFFIKEERLTAKNQNGKMVLKCESCGTLIETGRLCYGCKVRASLGDIKKASPINAKEAAPIMKTAHARFYTRSKD
jgi:Zn finger protein HypA/HybF involved in hydrogenase expression